MKGDIFVRRYPFFSLAFLKHLAPKYYEETSYRLLEVNVNIFLSLKIGKNRKHLFVTIVISGSCKGKIKGDLL
ncbi:hypothetical protein HMPREF3202_02476 [Prevotella bivia]|uniref:Uncharacterized protein n=1 Tax=Prevotella bivia TaxID=28125 RepID=A0A137SPN6_9BACT|nr:hypothetical protein HMPREF3202_02476 [Prevotella bivia]